GGCRDRSDQHNPPECHTSAVAPCSTRTASSAAEDASPARPARTAPSNEFDHQTPAPPTAPHRWSTGPEKPQSELVAIPKTGVTTAPQTVHSCLASVRARKLLLINN